MGVKFANPPLELGLKYHDPPHLTELKEKCSRLFQANKEKRKQKQNKRKAKKAEAKRMEVNCKRAIETILHLSKNRVMLQSLLAHYFFIMKE